MADKEYARANRRDHFANRLLSSIVLKGILAKPDLKSPSLVTSTPVAD